jgi:hypothetical protein
MYTANMDLSRNNFDHLIAKACIKKTEHGARARNKFRREAVLQGFIPSLYVALGLRVVRHSPYVSHFLVIQPFGQFARDVAEPFV